MNYKSIFKAVGVLAVAVIFCTGCSDKSDDGGNDTDSGKDSRLVLPDGDVWTRCDDEGFCSGMIFESSGKSSVITRQFGEWVATGTAAWHTDGNKLTVRGSTGEVTVFTYSISENTLTLNVRNDVYIMTRTSGINVITPP